MSFASLSQASVAPLLGRFAAATDVTLLVGAGASMEADLPSWPRLVERLLSSVAETRPDLPSANLKQEWIQQTLRRNDLLGAGAVVEVLAPERLDTLVPEQLYGPPGPAGYLPGPIARQVADLKLLFADQLEVLTTNYDDLIERALLEAGVAQTNIRSYIQDRRPDQRAQKTVAVVHLHGLAGRSEKPKRIVLTEEHYHRMQRGSSWQERLVTKRLEESLCLFVGMSLSDPNLIRYLYGYRQSDARKHAAIFVRQGDESLPGEVRAALEEAAIKRWARCGVEAVFIDHFADAAQLLHEIAYRRRAGDEYEPIEARASRLIDLAERWVLLTDRDQRLFAHRQVLLSEWLRGLLYTLLRTALDGDPPAEEKLAITLWLVSRDGTQLTGWAHSDRAHQDPATVMPLPIASDSHWVAIRTICQGARFERDRDIYASRWRFVRGLPLVIEQPSRLPIGCLTISSTRNGAESVLTQMPADRRAALHDALLEANRMLITRAIEVGAGGQEADEAGAAARPED
ncbi:MAG: SIR2 family protein [Thermomicrobiales bacterium]